LLDTCERVRKQFSRHQAELREQVLEHFEMLREQLERIGLLDDYERDDAGNLTAESILKKAGNGSILFHNPEEYDEAGPIQVFFHVEWDDEHGLDLSIIDEPEAEPAHQTAAIANVRFSESGPPINAADVDAFEKAHDVKLPAEYRNFLLQHNGGRPEPNHLKLNMGGAPMPVYVDRLFSIPSGGNGEDELGDAIDIHRANDLPAQFAPIGTARISGEAGRGTLVLDTSGRKAGRILFANDMGGMMPDGLGEAMMAEMTSATFEQCCVAVAPSMSAFLSRLTSARS
jgi:hypothetical protein